MNNISILEIDSVPVELTYSDLIGIGKTLKVAMRFELETSEDEAKARAAFIGLTEAEKKEKLPEWRAKRLSLLLTDSPVEMNILEGGKVVGEEVIPANKIFEYFNSTNPLRRKIANDALIRYEAVTNPAEFFRSV